MAVVAGKPRLPAGGNMRFEETKREPAACVSKWGRKGRSGLVQVFLSMLMLFITVQAQAPSATEYQIKAVFLYNFAKFVEWPPDSFRSPEQAMQICVLGENPFGEDLGILVRNKRVSGRVIRVEQLRKMRDLRTCHVLFIASTEASQLGQIFEELRGTSVLTVSDIAGFAHRGGMIGLVLDDDRVRFEINAQAASQARLKISSKLLSLARTVTE